MTHPRYLRAVLGSCSFLILAVPTPAQVSGSVVDGTTMAPIEGAIVSVQATTQRATTAADGSFSLPVATGNNLEIVGARKGYYNVGVTADGGDTGVMLFLDAVPQSDDPGYVFQHPNACGSCHNDQRDEWTGSPMSMAGTNLWVYDIYDGTGTTGGLGGFVYTRDSVHRLANPSSECASCHQPIPWVHTPFSPLEDLTNLSQGAMHGISCDVCHKIAHIDEALVNYPGIYPEVPGVNPEVVTLTRPAPADSQVQYGVLGDASFNIPSQMRPSYQPQLTSAMCAACHQDKNDPDLDGHFEEANGVISEPTYLEWLASDYADPGSGLAASCVDCHMPPTGATTASSLGSAPIRDPATIRDHRIEGTTAVYLENAVSMTLDSHRVGNTLTLDVAIENDQTGHHVPTGVTVRNMILLVDAWETSSGQPLTPTGGSVVHDLGGVGDPAQGYYAGLPGKFFAKVNHDGTGAGPTFFTDATGIQFDSRIPALATDSSRYTFRIPDGAGAVEARARLVYRRAFRFLVDAKQWTVDGHGNPLEDIAPPYYGHLMEEALSFFDCNGNGIEDALDISGATSFDTDGNGVPDECETPPAGALLRQDQNRPVRTVRGN